MRQKFCISETNFTSDIRRILQDRRYFSIFLKNIPRIAGNDTGGNAVYSRFVCGTPAGLSAEKVFVESDVTFGFPSFHIVGLADAAIRESKERVRSAVSHSGFSFPQERVTVNLSPADLRKEGTHFDLPVALGILTSAGRLSLSEAWRGEDWACAGELALDGRLIRIRGLLPVLLGLKETGIRRFVLPAENLEEARAVPEILVGIGRKICGRRQITSAGNAGYGK